MRIHNTKVFSGLVLLLRGCSRWHLVTKESGAASEDMIVLIDDIGYPIILCRNMIHYES